MIPRIPRISGCRILTSPIFHQTFHGFFSEKPGRFRWLVAPARSGTRPKTSGKTQQDDDRKRPVSQLRDCRISGKFSLSKQCFWGGFCCFPGRWVTSGAGFTMFAYPHESPKNPVKHAATAQNKS